LALCRSSARALALGAVAYLGVAVAALSLGLGKLLPERYQGITPMVVAWGPFLVVAVVRSVGSSGYVAWREVRVGLGFIAVASVVALALTLGLLRLVGVAGAPGGLAGGELCLVVLIWREIGRRVRGDAPTSAPTAAGVSA